MEAVDCIPINVLDPAPPNAKATLVNMLPHLIKGHMDPEHLWQYFAFLPAEVVAPTMDATTQHAHNVVVVTGHMW